MIRACFTKFVLVVSSPWWLGGCFDSDEVVGLPCENDSECPRHVCRSGVCVAADSGSNASADAEAEFVDTSGGEGSLDAGESMAGGVEGNGPGSDSVAGSTSHDTGTEGMGDDPGEADVDADDSAADRCGDDIEDLNEFCDHGPSNGKPDRCNGDCQFVCDGPCPIFVDGDVETPGEGASFESAFRTLAEAIELGQAERPIFLVAGSLPLMEPTQIPKSTRVYGGFHRHETSIEQRDERFQSSGRTYTSLETNDFERGSLTLLGNNRLDSIEFRRSVKSFLPSKTSSWPSLVVARDTSSIVVEGCRFVGGRSELGGGLHLDNVRNVEVRDSVFLDNISQRGGGLHIAHVEGLKLERCQFQYNEALGVPERSMGGQRKSIQGGGALYIGQSLGVHIKDTRFDRNRSVGDGAAIYVQSATSDELQPSFAASVIEFEGVDFTGNESQDYGGAIYSLPSSQLSFRDCRFLRNSAAHDGGAIAGNFAGIDLEVVDSYFADNRAGRKGGALMFAGTGFVLNSWFVNNHADREGGAVRLRGQCHFVAVNSFWLDNTAAGLSTAIATEVYDSGLPQTIELVHATILDRSESPTSTVHIEWEGSTVKNSVIWSNAAQAVSGPAASAWSSDEGSCDRSALDFAAAVVLRRRTLELVDGGEEELEYGLMTWPWECPAGLPEASEDPRWMGAIDWDGTSVFFDGPTDGEQGVRFPGVHHPKQSETP